MVCLFSMGTYRPKYTVYVFMMWVVHVWCACVVIAVVTKGNE